MEGLAVTTFDVTDVVAYARWRLQRKTDLVFALIDKCERRIVKLNNENEGLAEENSSLESYIKGPNEIKECIYRRHVESAERCCPTQKL